jgi:competence protein ComEA
MAHAAIAVRPAARDVDVAQSAVAISACRPRQFASSLSFHASFRSHHSRRKTMFSKFAALAFALALAAPGLLLAATPVNINQADAATIAKSLDGIGQSRAQAIVDWRTAHGPFKKADDLHHVKGIGKATIERNRDAILLGDDAAPTVAKADAPAKVAHKKRKAVSMETAAEE